MSECVQNCRLCDKFILSQTITFDGTNLVVNLPTGSYANCQKYCIVLAQAIPETTTINVGESTYDVLHFNRKNNRVFFCDMEAERAALVNALYGAPAAE